MTKEEFFKEIKAPEQEEEWPTWIKFLALKFFFRGLILGAVLAMVLMELLKG